MSAYVVGKEHIDALVSFGLAPGRVHGSWLTWFHRPVTTEELERTSIPGVAIPAASVELAQGLRQELNDLTADRVGAMLWAENVRSVAFRYNEPEDAADLPGPLDFEVMQVAEYRHERNDGFSPAEILSALACYEYQSCEHPGWATSEARQFCEALKDRAISQLPGMDDAPWEIQERRSPARFSR